MDEVALSKRRLMLETDEEEKEEKAVEPLEVEDVKLKQCALDRTMSRSLQPNQPNNLHYLDHANMSLGVEEESQMSSSRRRERSESSDSLVSAGRSTSTV